MNGLNFNLFGNVKVTRQDDPFEELRIGPLSQSLLAYLLLFPRPHRREELIDLFWDRNNLDTIRRCLSTTLWRLRGELAGEGNEPYILTASNGDISFNRKSQHWLDIAAFEENAHQGLTRPLAEMTAGEAAALEDAVQLYVGDLLEGSYADWTLSPREYLRSLHLKCLARLMEYYEGQKLYEQSIDFGTRIIALDPLREEIYRALMRLFYQTGRREEAVRLYDTCCRLLAKELHIQPLAETRALHGRIAAAQELQRDASTDPVAGELTGIHQRLDVVTNNLLTLTDQLERMLRQVQILIDR